MDIPKPLTEDVDVLFHNNTSIQDINVLIFSKLYPIPLTDQTIRMAWQFFQIPINGSIKFVYPHKTQVGAFFYEGGSNITAGPFDAEPGSTWIAKTLSETTMTLEQDSKSTTNSSLYHIYHSLESAPPVPDGGYSFHNKEPDDSSWTGRVIDVALFKGNIIGSIKSPFVSKRCRVGNYVTLKQVNKIYACIGIPAKSYVVSSLPPSLDSVLKDSGNHTPESILRKIASGHTELRYDTSEDTDAHLLPDSEFTPMTEIDLENCNQGQIEVKIVEQPGSGKISFIIDVEY